VPGEELAHADQAKVGEIRFAVGESARQGADAVQGVLNPLRCDKSDGPTTVLAKRMNERLSDLSRAFSICWRTL